jgi:hypothetical protein
VPQAKVEYRRWRFQTRADRPKPFATSLVSRCKKWRNARTPHRACAARAGRKFRSAAVRRSLSQSRANGDLDRIGYGTAPLQCRLSASGFSSGLDRFVEAGLYLPSPFGDLLLEHSDEPACLIELGAYALEFGLQAL